MLLLAGSIISFLSVSCNNGCLIIFPLVSLRRCSLLFRGLLIHVVGVCLARMFLVVVLTGCFCICFQWTLIISIFKKVLSCIIVISHVVWIRFVYLLLIIGIFVFWVLLRKIFSVWFEIGYCLLVVVCCFSLLLFS